MAEIALVLDDEERLGPERLAGPSSAPEIALVLHNLDDIARAYGPSAARAASDHVRSSLKSLLHGRHSPGLVEKVLRHLSELPVVHDGQRFHLVVSLDPIPGAPMSGSSDALSGRGAQAFPDDAWSKRYRDDMALAVTLFDAMRSGRLLLAWQPVRDADGTTGVLYHEALLRTIHTDAIDIESMVAGVSDSIEALERLGLARVLDRYVVVRVIDELLRDGDRRIGANISAQSLSDDAWWNGIFDALAVHPDVARRLVIEITETACASSQSAAAGFVSKLQRLGCSVAIDDFGAGFASVRSMLVLRPDIVKIDKLFVRLAAGDPGRRDFLRHLIALAGSLGADVVVEGIETADQSDMVRGLGARWQQGYHLGRPSLARPTARDTAPEVLPCGDFEPAQGPATGRFVNGRFPVFAPFMQRKAGVSIASFHRQSAGSGTG